MGKTYIVKIVPFDHVFCIFVIYDVLFHIIIIVKHEEAIHNIL